LHGLIADFDMKFDLAYGRPWRKPKHHCIKHLPKYLVLYGPLRGFWCMGFEGALQASGPASAALLYVCRAAVELHPCCAALVQRWCSAGAALVQRWCN
jgi:hypothetical protein